MRKIKPLVYQPGRYQPCKFPGRVANLSSPFPLRRYRNLAFLKLAFSITAPIKMPWQKSTSCAKHISTLELRKRNNKIFEFKHVMPFHKMLSYEISNKTFMICRHLLFVAYSTSLCLSYLSFQGLKKNIFPVNIQWNWMSFPDPKRHHISRLRKSPRSEDTFKRCTCEIA